MEGKIGKDCYGGKYLENCEMESSSPKHSPNHDLNETILPNSEISQVEDAYSNSTSLALNNETGRNRNDDEDHNSIPVEMETISEYTGEDQSDTELENSTGENMTIYEDPATENDGMGDAAIGSQTQAVPECSGDSSGPICNTNALRYDTIGDRNEIVDYASFLQGKLDRLIARIDEQWHSQCDATEQQLQANLAGTSSLELQEKFGIAETQIELINEILEEMKRKGARN